MINYYPILAAVEDICVIDPNQPNKLCNPTHAGDITVFITKSIVSLGVIIGILTIGMVVYSGFRMIISQGEVEEISKAKSAFRWSLSGFLLTMFAFIIVYAIGDFLDVQSIEQTPGQVQNPILSPDVFALIKTVLSNFLTLVGLLALFFIIISGFRYITANGNEELATKAKQGLLWSVLGLIISALAYVIVFATSNFIK